MDWIKNFKCRCSAITKVQSEKQGFEALTEKQERTIIEMESKATGKGLTEKQQEELNRLYAKREASKQIVLSDTCIDYLMEVYAWEVDGMINVGKDAMQDLAQISKGQKCEPDAIALISAVDGELYKTHKERIQNEYLSGQIDCYLGESVYEARNVTDIKNAFDRPTFLKKINTGLGYSQKEQLQGYGDITGAKELWVANTLVDNPEEDIQAAKFRLATKMGALTTESPEFLKEWAKWERSMRFKKIHPHRRVFKIPVTPFTEFERQKLYDRVKACREWLYIFAEKEQSLNLNVSLVQNDAT